VAREGGRGHLDGVSRLTTATKRDGAVAAATKQTAAFAAAGFSAVEAAAGDFIAAAGTIAAPCWRTAG